MIGVEITATPDSTASGPIDEPHHRLLFEHERLRAYRLQLEPGQSTGMIDDECSFAAMISLGQACVTLREPPGRSVTLTFEAGTAGWYPGPAKRTITNSGESTFRAIVGEWR